MVAVISGNGLGLGNTSLTQLGQPQGGSPSLGQAGNRSYVNAATGNLILQSNDEGLLFDGLPLNVLRTYNSLGQLNGNDGWTYGFSRSVNGLTGTLNTAGSTITRTDDDGSSVVYTYNATLGVYQSTDQSGAIDTLSWNATSSSWTWTDAASTTQETYNATGQLTALTDTSSGASYNFSYSNGNGQLSQIVANDGDTLIFHYTSNQLTSLWIQEVPPGQSTAVTRQAVSYGYDSQGRLNTVTTTLGSDTDTTSASYTTTYGYQGSTDLVSSVTQSDGTTASYSYTQDAQGAYQVTGITTGSGSAAQTLNVSYGTNTVKVTDGVGNITTYQTDAQGQLTSVTEPAVNGVSPTTTYTYLNGNLLTRTDPNGAVTTYTYDANGNLLSVEDGAGNTVSYTYNANDQVTSKTIYTVPAQGRVGQSGYVAPSGAETTYYVYNATSQLAYTIDALGNVSENDYTTVNGLSELTTTRQYLGATYSTGNNSPSTPPALADLQAWVQSSAVQSTLAQSTRTGFVYDVRGQLAMQTRYDTVDSNGNGVLTNGTVITTTTYDAQGRLLQTSTETGANRSTLQTTTYAYDGLGRMTSKIDPLTNVTSYVYTDSAHTIAITQANGLTTTQVRNSAGQLLSSTQSASGQTSRITNYLYNADGEQIAAIDPAGNGTYTYYNADGEAAGTVDGDGNVTAYTYDADGHVVQTTQYATPVNPSGWFSNGALTGSYPANLPVPASSANDRIATTIYNAAGQVVATIDPANNVVATIYDGTGQVVATTRYAVPLSSAERNGLSHPPALSDLTAYFAANANNPQNRTTLAIHDADGRTVATVDGQGYVTVTTYNAAGEVVSQTAYATALTASQLSNLGDTPTLQALPIATSAQDQTTRTYYDSDGRVAATIDADGYLGTTAYDETKSTDTTTRYAAPLTSTQLGALTGSESIATLVGLLGNNTANEQSSVSYNADGQVASRTATDGTVTSYTYNSVGQLHITTVTPASGQGEARSTNVLYDPFGDLQSATNAAQATTTYVYNTLGQQVEATDALGNSTWSYYDANGNLRYTIQGQPSGGTRNVLGNVTEYQYGDAFNEVTATITYAGQLTLTTTGTSSGATLNVATATTGQVAAALATPLAAPNGDANATSLTTYTLDGQVATVTDGDGYITATSYDAFGDMVSVQQQLNQPGSALNANNSTLTGYTYDNRGERLNETDGVGTPIARSTSQTYDAFGRVSSTVDGNGNTITYTYDKLGRQVSSSQTVQGATRATHTTYDAFGNVLTETDALGKVTTFSYNVATHTATVTTPGGVTTTTVKDAYGETVSVTDGSGNTTSYSYYSDGRLHTTTDALGNISSRQDDADGELLQTTDASGRVVTYTYDASGKVLTQTVDPAGLNLVTTYSYDGQGRQLSVTDPAGSVTAYRYDPDGNVMTRIVDANGLGLATSYTYDGAGKTLTVTTGYGTSAATTTQYIYDKLGRLYQTIVAPGQLGFTTTYAYDANDNLVSKTDANGNVTRYVYDQADELIYTIDPTGAVTQNWYDADGRLATTRGYVTLLTAAQLSALGSAPTIAAVANALTTSTADSYHQRIYNADGQVVYDLIGVGLNTTQYTYNAAGQVTQTRVYAIQPSVNAWTLSSFSPVATPAALAAALTASGNDLVTTTAYDADGRAAYTIDGAGDVTHTIYDPAGRVTQTIAYATPLTSARLASLGSTPTAAQLAVLFPSGSVGRATTTSYDAAGRPVYRINAAGAVTQTIYDADGRITSTHAYATALSGSLGSAPTPAQIAPLLTPTASDATTYNVYDGAGDLRYRIDPKGYVTETRYDASGRVIETLAYANAINTSGETGALQAGTALSWISGQVGGASGSNPDSSAEATLTLYDAAGRRAFTVQQNNAGTTGQVTAYAYDANGNLSSQTVYGNTLTLSASQSLSAQLTTAGVAGAVAGFAAHETTHTVYDADYRALYIVDALGYVTQNSYDGVGRLIETQQYANPITLPGTINASTIATAVAAAGTAGARISTTTYDSRGDVVATGDALGINATYGYDGRDLKTSYTNRDGATWTYTYDSAGRLIQTQSPPVTVGSYNSSNGQFQSAANQYLYTTSTYDAFGNVTSTSQGYGANASAITTVSTTRYAYDAAGHQVQVTDALNHATATLYNALGQAVVNKDANGNTSYRVYNVSGELAYAIDGNGYVTAYTYDAYGNTLTTTRYATALNTVSVTGWSAGQPLSTDQVRQGLVVSGSDRTLTATYNQLNQKTQLVQSSITYVLSMGALSGNVATGSPTTTYTYDAYGNVTSVSQLMQGAFTSGSTTTPAIWATTYTYYDALNRAVMVVTPAGNYTSPQGYVTTTAYDAFGHVKSSTQYAQAISTSGITTSAVPSVPGGATVASGADRVTSYTYDAIGRVLTETQTGGYSYTGGTLGQPNGAAAYAIASSLTSYTYNGENQVTSQTVNGTTTTTVYDALGRVLTVTAPARQVLVSNWESVLESTPADDLTTASLYVSVSPVTTYVYDALGDALSINVSAGGQSLQTWSYFDNLGRMSGQFDTDGNFHNTTYDANGNVLTQSYTLTGSTTVTTTHTYDADNQLLSTAVQRSGVGTYDSYTQQKYNAFGEVFAKGDNNGYEAIYTYDNDGNLITAPNSSTGAIHTYGYDLAGRKTTDNSYVTVGGAQTWTHDWLDLAGNVIQERMPATNASSGVNGSVQSSMTYDRWGNVTSKTDPNGNVTTYRYTSQNQVYQQIEANVMVVSATGTRTWSTPTREWYYNVAGELIGTTDENSNSSWYFYDAAGNQTIAQDNLGNRTYTAYDALGRAVATQTPPAETAGGPISRITYTNYDNLGQVTGQGDFLLNSTGTARTLAAQETYLLDNNGDRIQVTDALGNTLYYSFDSQHHVLQSQTPIQHANGWAETFTYDVNGNKTGDTTANGDHQSWVYDYFGRVQSHVDLNGDTTTYTYDNNSGLLTSQSSNWTPGGPGDPAYVPGLWQGSSSQQTYTYYADGQLASTTLITAGTTSAWDTYQYDADGNQTVDATYTTDGAGQVVHTETITQYDSHNRLSVVTMENPDSGTINMREAFNYDAAGNRRAVFVQSAYGPTASPIGTGTGGPTVTAIGNQTVQPGQGWSYSVASAFNDTLGFGLTYTATQSDGSALPSWLNLTSNGNLVGNPAANGSWSITVTGTDASGKSASTTFTVTVPVVNPVFTGGVGTQTAHIGSAFSITVPPATDANGVSVSYTALFNGDWLPSWLHFNASTLTFTGTPPAGTVGNYNLWVEANASNGGSQILQIAFNVVATPPAYNGGFSNQTTFGGRAFNFSFASGDFTESDGDGVSFAAGSYTSSGGVETDSALPSWMNFSASAGSLTFTGTPPTAVVGQTFYLYVRATNPQGQSVEAYFSVTVQQYVQPAPVYNGGLSNHTGVIGASLNIPLPNGAFVEPDGGALTYTGMVLVPQHDVDYPVNGGTDVGTTTIPAAWVDISKVGLSVNPVTGAITGSPTALKYQISKVGNGAYEYDTSYQLEIIATNGQGGAVSGAFTLSNSYGPPVATSGIPTQTTSPGNAWSYTLPSVFSDPYGHGLTYSASGVPGWMSFSNGVFSTSASAIQPPGNYSITVTATDGLGHTGSTSFTVSVPTVAPVFTAGAANQVLTQGSGFSFQVPGATDANGLGVSYTAAWINGSQVVGLPSWMSFNGSTRTYSGTPPAGSNGSYTIACTASAGGPWSTITFTVVVNAAAPSPPQYVGTLNGWEFGSAPNKSFSFNASGQFRDPQGEPLTYTATLANGTALPGWLVFNASTQTFTGTTLPNNTGNDKVTNVRLTATDSSGLSTSINFTIDVVGGKQFVVKAPAAQAATMQSAQAQTTQASSTTTPNIQAEWFTYDADNRVVIDNGALVNGNVAMTAGSYYAPSYTNEYDAAGNVIVRKTINSDTYTFQSGTTVKTYQAGDVMSQQMYYDTRNELVMTAFAVDVTQGETNLGVQTRQTYDADGHQLSTNTYLRSDTIHAVYGTHDEPNGYMYLGIGGWLANGEVSGYNADGQLTEQVSFSSDYRTGQWWLGVANNDNNTGNLPNGGADAVPSLSSDGPLVVGSTTSYTAYDHADNLTDYSFNENATPDGQTAAFGATYHVTYAKKDGYLQQTTSGTPTVSGYIPATDTLYYDDFGRLLSVSQSSQNANGAAQNSTRVYAYDAAGQIVLSRAGTSSGGSFTAYGSYATNHYTYVNGQELASVDEAGDITAATALTGFSNGTGSSNYVVQQGDTLQSIAQAEYGSSTLSYVIAEANGLGDGSGLVVGQAITIPAVTTENNSATTFKPYNPGSIIGSTTPNLPVAPPPPSSSGCGGIAQIIEIVVVIVASIYTAGLAAEAFAGTLAASAGTTFSAGLSALSSGLAGTAAAGITTAETLGAAFIGGAVGNAVGQATGDALGISKGFSFGAMLSGGLTAAAGSALGGALAGSGDASLVTTAANGTHTLTSLGAAVLGAGDYAAGNAANAIAGQPTHFSWAGLVAATLSSAVTSEVGAPNGVEQKMGISSGSFGQDLMGGLLSGAVNKETTQLLGDDRTQSWENVGEDAFGNALGNAAVRRVAAAPQSQSTVLYSPTQGYGPYVDAGLVSIDSPTEASSTPLTFGLYRQAVAAYAGAQNSNSFATMNGGKAVLPDGVILPDDSTDMGPVQYAFNRDGSVLASPNSNALAYPVENEPNDIYHTPIGPDGSYELIGTSEDGKTLQIDASSIVQTGGIESEDGRSGYLYSDGTETFGYSGTLGELQPDWSAVNANMMSVADPADVLPEGTGGVVRALGSIYGFGRGAWHAAAGGLLAARALVGADFDFVAGRSGLNITNYFEGDTEQFGQMVQGVDHFVHNDPLGTVVNAFKTRLDQSAALSDSQTISGQWASGADFGELGFDTYTAVDGGIAATKLGVAGVKLAGNGLAAFADALGDLKFVGSGDGSGRLGPQIGAVGDDVLKVLNNGGRTNAEVSGLLEEGGSVQEVAASEVLQSEDVPISEAAARAPSGFTTAYRAVSQAEYDDALATGSFNQGPNSLEGKWFADSYDNALLHGDALEGPGNYKILEADLPNNAPSLFKLQNLDGRGPATYIHLDDLQGVTPRPYGGR